MITQNETRTLGDDQGSNRIEAGPDRVAEIAEGEPDVEDVTGRQ